MNKKMAPRQPGTAPQIMLLPGMMPREAFPHAAKRNAAFRIWKAAFCRFLCRREAA